MDAPEGVVAFKRYTHDAELRVWINLSEESYLIPDDIGEKPIFSYGAVRQSKSGYSLESLAALIIP